MKRLSILLVAMLLIASAAQDRAEQVMQNLRAASAERREGTECRTRRSPDH